MDKLSAPPSGGAWITRRGLLALLTGALAAAIGAAIGATGLAYFLAPARAREEEDWVDLGPASALPRSAPTRLDFVERRHDAWNVVERRASAWVVTDGGGDFSIFDPACTHLGCPYRWDAGKDRFLCPCHGGEFAKDGRVLAGPPPRPLDRYVWKVRAGRLLVRPAAQGGAT